MSDIIDKILRDSKSATNTLSDFDPFNDVRGWIPFGVPSLYPFLRIPGFPSGSVVEICGLEQGGKTTLGWHIVARAQKILKDVLIVILATERRSRKGYPGVIGVQEDKCILERPKTIEECFSTIEYWINETRSKYGKDFPIIFLWDSLGGTPTKAEAESESDQDFMAVAARVIKKNLRRLVQVIDDSNTLLIIINQVYEKMNVTFGGRKTTSYGGRAVKFHSTIRMQLDNIGQIKSGTTIVGQKVQFDLLKCDFSPPKRKVVIPLLFGFGFTLSREDMLLGVEYNLLEKWKTGFMLKSNPNIKWKSEDEFLKLMIENEKVRFIVHRLFDSRFKNRELLKKEKLNLE